MATRVSLVGAILLCLLSAKTGKAQTPSDSAEIQRAVERGLFFIERHSMKWWKTEKCATCHEGQMLLFAANAAKARGVPVDQAKLDFWTDRWILVDALALNDKGVQNGLELQTGTFVLSYRDAAREDSEPRAEQWAGVLKELFLSQQQDGQWEEDKPERNHGTPRMALALADLEQSRIPFRTELRREIVERRQRTDAWIAAHEPQRPEKTESLAGWAEYEHRRGTPERAKLLLDELLDRRRVDGGWGIKKNDPSHLLVTAVALLALTNCGLPNDHPVVAATQRRLLDAQTADGSWHELGRQFGPEAYDVSYDVWTTGFAVAALCQTMPKLPPGAKTLFLPDSNLVAEVDQLRIAAAEGYTGRKDRSGDPTQIKDSTAPAK